jgi:hypothetical protein
MDPTDYSGETMNTTSADADTARRRPVGGAARGRATVLPTSNSSTQAEPAVADDGESRNSLRGQLRETVSDRTLIFLTVTVDLLLLVAWRGVLWAFDHLIGWLGESGDISWQIAHYTFAALTIICVLVMAYWDIREIYRYLRDRYRRGGKNDAREDRPRAG